MSIRCISHPLRGQPRVGWRDVQACQETSSPSHSLPWGLQSLAGCKSPTEKIWICLWGGRGWKYLRMKECPIPGLELTGAWGGHQCKQTLHQLTGVQWQSAVELLFQVAQSCTQWFKHTVIISLTQMQTEASDNRYFADVSSAVCKLGFFFKFRARVSYYCLLTGSWLAIFHACQLVLHNAEFIMHLLLASQFHHCYIS